MTQLSSLDYAILSLDSYNRGYGASVDVSGTTIGGLTIVMDSVILNTDPNDPIRVDEAASFYAAAYRDADGNIVISYRGTDNPSLLQFDSDFYQGWPGGGGYETEQADLAAQFYNLVKDTYPNATISLTGHSLGGGLAGLVAKLKTRCHAAARHPNPGYQIPNAHGIGIDFK